MSPRDLPPSNLRVRIVGNKSKQALYTNKEYPGELWYADPSTNKNDQYWYIIPNHQEHRAGTFQIQSAVTHQNLCMNPPWMGGEGNVATSSPEIANDDQAIRFVFSEDDKSYRFERPDGNTTWKLYCRDTWQKPTLGCVKLPGEFDDQWFSFEYEPLEFIGIHYDHGNVEIKDNKLVGVFEECHKNNTTSAQSFTFAKSGTTERVSTWEVSVGAEITQSVAVQVGIPDVANTTSTSIGTLRAGLSYNTSTRTTETWSMSANPTCEFGKTVKCVAMLEKCSIQVPFTATYKTRKTGEEIKIKGTYLGENCGDKVNAETFYV